MRQIKHHLRDNKADEYIPALICTTIMLIISAIVICVVSTVNTRLWLDEKLDDISEIIETTGWLDSESLIAIEDKIENRLGGTVSFTGSIIRETGAEGRHYVQLNEAVTVNYYNPDFTAVSVGGFKISTDISLSKKAVSTNYIRGLNEYTTLETYAH